ncbi:MULTISPECIES: restriction endonuclease subunit S [unclassified Nostoc]|uniref:restriction endonuclease subunit S n=1 Tax=unclassified Nostoc TaxID=2593658 RepID=UPI002AD2F252|nr:restriction endonuclease subunit S [Nostoc sp. DedQUE03]MDZ7977255.1 restriction endonuclease subunit S [Nostoc sp. DedQUE03]MDZ8047624.1 restriction endonuclease subunit S [Nostoc sp. DedQUE02]
MSKRLSQNVPKLRFPEFKGDWEYFKIEDIASVTSGGTPNRSEPSFWNGNIPWVTTSEIGQAEIHDSIEKITEKGLQNSSAKIFKKDTILLAMYGQGKTRGQVSILKIEAATNQACAAIALKSDFNSQFVYYFLFKEYENLRVLANDGSQKNLTAGLIKQYKVPVTHINEQEKIASFLGAVDRRLTQLRHKQELLQIYKRGVMQKLFSQQIRFKQDYYTPFPDWKRKKLSDISKPVKRSLELEKNVPVMSISAGFGFLNQKERFSQVIAGSSLDKYTLIHKGEFSYNRGASKAFPYGCIYLMKEHEEALIPFVYRTFQLTHGIKSFFAQYFLTGILDRELRKLISSSARMDGLLNIGEKDFYTLSIPFPVEEEQEKIANFITAIDQKIEAISRQIYHTERFKKGLLQKMFV